MPTEVSARTRCMHGDHPLQYSPADDCICDACNERGIETIGTDYRCANGCDFDLCRSCFRAQDGPTASLAWASPHRQRLEAAVHAARIRPSADAAHTGPRGRPARLLLTPSAPGVSTTPQWRPSQAVSTALAGLGGTPHPQVRNVVQAEVRAEHETWLKLPPPRIDELPLFSLLSYWSSTMRASARRATLERLGGSDGMSALVDDRAPLPPPLALQPPPPGEGVSPSAVASLKMYYELGWPWGVLAAVGLKGCWLGGWVLYFLWYYRSMFGGLATTISAGLLAGQVLLWAPGLLYWAVVGAPPHHEPADATRIAHEQAASTMAVVCAQRALELENVGAVRSAALTLKAVCDSILANAQRHGFGAHTTQQDSLGQDPVGLRHAVLFENLATAWERVLRSEGPGLSPAELQTVARWFREWSAAEHPVMTWWQEEQQYGGLTTSGTQTHREKRWAGIYGMLTAGSAGRLRFCPPDFDPESIEALAVSRARSSPAGSWATPRPDLSSEWAEREGDDGALDGATAEEVEEAVAGALQSVTWEDLGDAAFIQLSIDHGSFSGPLSRGAFDEAMRRAQGVAGSFTSQPERPLNFRFYDLLAIEQAFGLSAALRERHLSEAEGGLRRRWMQQLLVEYLPSGAGRGGRGVAGASLVLTVWPSQAHWRAATRQWVTAQDLPWDCLYLR